MEGTYDPRLVALSMIVATFASYVALDLASRVTAYRGWAARWWLVAGAISMGIGIWSMHFIGMLAFRLPMPVAYDVPVTVLSLVIAIGVSGFALHTASRPHVDTRRLVGGGVLMGIGIASMHYTGMAAMRMTPPPSYRPGLFAASLVIAIVASIVALAIAFRFREQSAGAAWERKVGSALLMGAAICGMHYTGMAAAVFPPHAMAAPVDDGLPNLWLAASIGLFTVLLLATTLVVSITDARRAREVGGYRHDALEFQRSRDEMELRVRERTAELARINVALEAEIAEHRRTELALRASEADARKIVDTAHDAFIGMDAHGRVLEWNRRAEQLFGWSREEAVLQPAAELFLPVDDREPHRREIERFLATGVSAILDRRIGITARDRRGREFAVEMSLWPVKVGEEYRFNAFLRELGEAARVRGEDAA